MANSRSSKKEYLIGVLVGCCVISFILANIPLISVNLKILTSRFLIETKSTSVECYLRYYSWVRTVIIMSEVKYLLFLALSSILFIVFSSSAMDAYHTVTLNPAGQFAELNLFPCLRVWEIIIWHSAEISNG